MSVCPNRLKDFERRHIIKSKFPCRGRFHYFISGGDVGLIMCLCFPCLLCSFPLFLCGGIENILNLLPCFGKPCVNNIFKGITYRNDTYRRIARVSYFALPFFISGICQHIIKTYIDRLFIAIKRQKDSHITINTRYSIRGSI